MSKPRVQSFPPLVTNGCTALVLGSMPGVASLNAVQYYAHPQNLFWPFMGELFGFDSKTSYEQRCAQLLAHHVAVWDVLAQCEREGSLDSAISRATEEPNDLCGLLLAYPTINTILLNGAKAATAFHRHIKGVSIDVIALPSTSPANASMSRATKFTKWESAFERVMRHRGSP